MSIYSNNYYVYAYLRASDNTPYYIGKGKNNRFLQKHPGVSIPKDQSKIVFLEKNLLLGYPHAISSVFTIKIRFRTNTDISGYGHDTFNKLRMFRFSV